MEKEQKPYTDNPDEYTSDERLIIHLCDNCGVVFRCDTRRLPPVVAIASLEMVAAEIIFHQEGHCIVGPFEEEALSTVVVGRIGRA